MSSARQTGFSFAFYSICFSLSGVDERRSLAFEIGLEWVVCHKTGLSTTFNWILTIMPGKRKIKPQVESLSIFKKAGMVGSLELHVVNRPFSWRVVSSMLISVPELAQLFVSCGDIGTVWRFGASKQSLYHRNLEGAGGVG